MSITTNIQSVQRRINDACMRCGRDPETVTLVLATKTVDSERLREAYEVGATAFGENRVQEALPKYDELLDLDIEWHFIGHLQTNKVRDVLKFATCIQSVDRQSLVDELDAECERRGEGVDILVEVNASGEASKHGCAVDAVDELLEYIQEREWLNVRGFMTIGAMSDDETVVRASFARLRAIRDRAIARGLVPSDAVHLSMGMSSDLDIAIEEGSTMVRVGSAIFGERT
ncbi:MAG: YggS family pyridoxal phosphate-dependent enzyme [Candidatus Kapabacteria bacterium]|nr:YggS family pyridoxal phosphate-dependent enzyme [Candidatus Kapabacteria bacterium]